ncbi:hypothetical protein QYM36_005475 [Artemia franciscana]|uniref:RNA-directed DNA polymerase n=1 Tax=Artemia franciscana TaxID=6661 RepID=A0AA88I4P9_ARTSF|nr:hypothetical protein QYM36_005475 [Artemia franciscana]
MTDILEIIKQVKPPNNQKTCRSVCGLLSYFRHYVLNFVTIAKPLTKLLKKSGNFECPPAAVEALSKLKQELLKAPVLELPNLSHDLAYKRMHHKGGKSLTIAEIQEESAIFSIRNIALHQDKDDFCSSMKKFIAEVKELPEHYKHHMKDIDHYELDEDKNVLGRYYRPIQTYRQNDTRLIPVIPKSMEGEVIYLLHVVNGCHMGEAKTMGRIKGNIHFPNMYKKVKEFILSYEDCAKHKSPQTMPRAEFGTYGVPAGVGDLISIDIWGSGG